MAVTTVPDRVGTVNKDHNRKILCLLCMCQELQAIYKAGSDMN